jgi:DNA-binding IclR family transcriptional regulator
MSSVPAAAQTVAILRVLADRGPTAAVSLARAVGMPRSSAYHLLTVLRESGVVVHLPEERRWALGPVTFEIGMAYLRHDPLERLARPHLAALADRVSETAHLSVLHGAEVVYLAKEVPRRRTAPPTLVTDVGVRLPATLTASGRAMLGALPAAQVRALLAGERAFVDRTGRGPRSWTSLRRVLGEESARGWASEDGEVVEGLASVAAVVRDRLGAPVAAVSVTFRSGEHPVAERAALATEVVVAAGRIESGYAPSAR